MERSRVRALAGWFVFALATPGCIADATPDDMKTPTAGQDDETDGMNADDDDDDDRPIPDDDDDDDDDDDVDPDGDDDDDDDDDAQPTDCCSASPDAGCVVPSVAECVCEASAFCCTIAWDQECVDIANEDCGGCAGDGTTPGDDDDDDDDDTPGTDDGGPVGDGDCCVEAPTPGCNDEEIQSCVCDFDDFCCLSEWDNYCVAGAAECGAGCDVGPGPDEPGPEVAPCCAAGDVGQCDDETVTACVCEIDAACCDEAWDASCVVTSIESCSNACPEYDVMGDGDCCEANATPGCSDAAIQLCTCAQDPFCCTNEWDAYCVEGSALACESGCDIPDEGGEGGEGGGTGA